MEFLVKKSKKYFLRWVVHFGSTFCHFWRFQIFDFGKYAPQGKILTKKRSNWLILPPLFSLFSLSVMDKMSIIDNVNVNPPPEKVKK